LWSETKNMVEIVETQDKTKLRLSRCWSCPCISKGNQRFSLGKFERLDKNCINIGCMDCFFIVFIYQKNNNYLKKLQRLWNQLHLLQIIFVGSHVCICCFCALCVGGNLTTDWRFSFANTICNEVSASFKAWLSTSNQWSSCKSWELKTSICMEDFPLQ